MIQKPLLVKAKTALRKQNKNKIWRKTIFNMADRILTLCNVARSWHWFHQVTAPCNVACGSGIMTVNSPSGSRATLQSDTWLWKFYPNRTTLGRKKMTLCRFSRWRISAILDFRGPIMGSLKSPCTTTYYRSSIETIALNCLVFEKIAFLHFDDTYRTNR